MPQVTFIAFDGHRNEIDASIGESLMHAAVSHGIAGIDGDCGGQCACATCHIFVDSSWARLLPAAEGMEAEMLSFAAEYRPTSRLACQIRVTEHLEGIEVTMPEAQH